jgi:dihydropteroate synthase
MHMHGEPTTMQVSPMAGDAVPEVVKFLRQRHARLCGQGMATARIMVDPGIGFGKTVPQNFSLLARQAEVGSIAPVLAGWSRKSSIGAVTGLPVHDRMVPSVVAAVLAVERGAAVVRVHDVAETVAALAVWRETCAMRPHGASVDDLA